MFAGSRFCDDFIVELLDLYPKHRENLPPLGGQLVVPTRPFAARRARLAAQPSQAFQSVKQRIQRARANLITMPAQLRDHPLAMKRLFARVMQDVRFPKAQQNLALKFFHSVLRSPIAVVDIDNRYLIPETASSQ